MTKQEIEKAANEFANSFGSMEPCIAKIKQDVAVRAFVIGATMVNKKQPYTPDDIFDFIKWGFTKPGYMRNYFNYFRGDTKGFFTPSELLKKWEDCKLQQGKEATE